MSLLDKIKNYVPVNEQEMRDKEVMIQFIEGNDDYLDRTNLVAHFTTSIWTVNKERTKTLMAYHNIYDSWAWIGGHADGIEDLCQVALRELQEETGVTHGKILSEDIMSLEVLTVNGHIKRGQYVPSHLHMNITFLAQADESEDLVVNKEENQAVRWFTFEEALAASKESWMVENIYKKLIERTKQ
ncbi:MAG: NUDIX hydrolase [Lachnospiraceae bacterium]|nr:NUDIX hydrolase [Lachnospiraceae bacterium]